MTRTRFAWAVAILVAFLGGMTANAGNVDWDNGEPANNYWNSPANWVGDGLPGSGDNPQFSGGPKSTAITPAYTADLNGAAINVGSGTVGLYKGNEGGFALIDSAGGGSITCGVFHVQQGGRPAYEVRVPVTATTEIRTRYRLGSVKFYGELNTPEVDLGRGDGVYFYGDVNATSVFKLVLDDSSTNAYLMPNPEVGGSPTPTLTTPLVHLEDSSSKFEVSGIVDADTIEITDGARYFAKHASGLGDATTNVTVSNGGYLQIDIPQASLALINVGAFSVLAGDLTGATYGGGGKVTLVENAVLAPASGSPVPTRADLGGDAILYQGLTTTNNTVTVGDNEVDAIYKGAAVGAFYGNTNMTNTSVTAQAGSGNLQVVFAGAGCPNVSNNNRFFGDGTSTTADIAVLNGALFRLRGSLNSDYDYVAGGEPTRIDTFNISGEAGKEAVTILDHYNTTGTHITEGQTWNISNGKWNPGTYVAGRGQHGDVTLTDGIMQQAGTAYSATADDGFTLTLAGRTVVETHDAANHGFLEELSGNFSYSGMPVVTLTNNQNYAIDYDTSPAGANPILADLMMNADISSVTYQQIYFDGDLKIGHGKYLYNALYRQDDHAGVSSATGKIVPAGNQPSGEKPIIGFAATALGSGKNIDIDMDVDAPGAIIRCGTTDPDRIMVASSGGFVTAVPTGTVIFHGGVAADELQVRSGTAQFAQDLDIATIDIGIGSTLQMNGAMTATANRRLAGAGNFSGGNGIVLASGGTVAPGDGVGQLTGNAPLFLEGDASYEWELLDPDLPAGDGWDMFFSDSRVGFGGKLDIVLSDAGLTKDVTPGMEFLIADIEVFNSLPTDVMVLAGDTGWIVDPDGIRIEPVGQGGRIYISGIDTTQQGPGPDGIPEPATLSLLGLGALALLRRRRR